MNSKKKIKEKSESILFVIFIFSILPFIILTFFNHPAGAEDYFFWNRMENVGFYRAMVSLYIQWSGRFFSHAELLLSPFFYRTIIGYKIFTFFLMTLLFLSVYLLISVLFKKFITTKERVLFCLTITFLYLFGMDTVSQGFYWLISTIVYHNALLLILLFIVFYNKFCRANTSYKKYLYTIILCFCAAAISGSNEIALVFILMLVSYFIISDLLFRKKLNWHLVFVFIVILISAYIDSNSSGTKLRAEKFVGHLDLFNAFLLTLKVLLEYVFYWIFLSPLLILTAFLVPLFLKIVSHRNEFSSNLILSPVIGFVISFIFLFVCFFIPVWSFGYTPYGRIINFIYFLFLLIWFFNVFALIYFLNKKYDFKKLVIPKNVSIIFISIIIIFAINSKNITTAYSDLFTGTAYKFNNEMNERYKYILENKSDSIVLKSIEYFPETIYPFDITDDPKIIYNQWYAKFFNKKSVIVKKP